MGYKMSNIEFSGMRRLLWPVHSFELKKLLPMLALFFFISFNYSILRTAKDTLVIDAAGSAFIPFLKVWAVTPAAIIFMLLFAKVSNMVDKRQLFYLSMVPFVAYFAFFSLVIYPNLDFFNLTGVANWLRDQLPNSLGSGSEFFLNKMIQLIEYWSLTLFYVAAELWGSVMLSLSFWGFANDITKISESKRFYGLFGIGANIALFAAGYTTKILSKNIFPDNYDGVMQSTIALFMASAFAITLIYRWINKNVLTDKRFYDPTQVKGKKKSKPKLSIGESMKFLFTNKYLLLLAVLVMSYGISINLIEVAWKTQAKLLYSSKTEYTAFNSYYQMWLASTTIFMMLFVSSNSLRIFGWRFTAAVTPVVTLVTGIIFFSLIIFEKQFGPLVEATLPFTPLAVTVFIGTIQNVFSKAAKYSLFDPTKEMAYIPLDEESKVKGKAAIDVVGARMGKAGGSLIQQVMPVLVPTYMISSALGFVTIAVLFAWVVAVYALAPKFESASKDMDEEQLGIA